MRCARKVLGERLRIKKKLQVIVLKEMIDSRLIEKINQDRIVVRAQGGGRGSWRVGSD